MAVVSSQPNEALRRIGATMHVLRRPQNSKVRSITMSEAEYFDLQDNGGICLGCDATQSQVEPDVRRVTCQSCGKPFVYGAAQLLVMGRIEFTVAAAQDETHAG